MADIAAREVNLTTLLPHFGRAKGTYSASGTTVELQVRSPYTRCAARPALLAGHSVAVAAATPALRSSALTALLDRSSRWCTNGPQNSDERLGC